MPKQATASDLPFKDIFVTQKVLSKISDDVIASDSWFIPPPQSKILATPMGSGLIYVLDLRFRRLLLTQLLSLRSND